MKTPSENVYPELTSEVVHALLAYDKRTGLLTWKHTRARTARKGDEAGTVDRHGYVTIMLMGRRVQAHRLIWFMVHGAWPAERLHPADGDPLNLRVRNWVLHSDWVRDEPKAIKRRAYYASRKAKRDAEPLRAVYLEQKDARRAEDLQILARRAELRKPQLTGPALTVRRTRRLPPA